jgi:hypothetical protein
MWRALQLLAKLFVLWMMGAWGMMLCGEAGRVWA